MNLELLNECAELATLEQKTDAIDLAQKVIDSIPDGKDDRMVLFNRLIEAYSVIELLNAKIVKQ